MKRKQSTEKRAVSFISTVTLKFLATYLIVFLMLCGCKKENEVVPASSTSKSDQISVKNGRLAFPDVEVYSSAMKELKQLDENAKKGWAKKYNFSSLATSSSEASKSTLADLDSNYIPSFIKSILNEHGECQIGDSIIWFNNGLKYIVLADEAALQKVKENPKAYPRKLKAAGRLISLPTDNARISIITNGTDARHQAVVWYVWPYLLRKYVHELVAYTDYLYTVEFNLELREKMEYANSSGNWLPAGEPRNITNNITYDVAVYELDGGGYRIGGSVYSTSGSKNFTLNNIGDLWIPLLPTGAGASSHSNYEYSVEVSGSIQQVIVGAPISTWNNQGNPLW